MARLQVGQRVTFKWDELLRRKEVEGKYISWTIYDEVRARRYAPGPYDKKYSFSVRQVRIKKNGGAKYIVTRHWVDYKGMARNHTSYVEVAPWMLQAEKVLEEADYEEMI